MRSYFRGRLDEFSAFADGMTAGLLHVHVLARLTGPNGHQRVPVVGRDNGNGIEGLVVQGPANVLDADGRVAGRSLHEVASGGEQPAVGIDQVGDLDILHPAESCDVGLSPPVDACDGDPDTIVGSQHSPGGPRAGERERRQCAAGNGTFQEVTAMVTKHGSSFWKRKTRNKEDYSAGHPHAARRAFLDQQFMRQREGIGNLAADDPGQFDQLVVVSSRHRRERDFLVTLPCRNREGWTGPAGA